MNAVAADARPLPRLLIEDDAVAAGLMSDELQAADDLPVEHVSTLADGVRAAARGVAVVVLDLGLPDSAGTETFYAFSARHPDLPVVVVSGHPREPIGHELIRAGAEEFVEKSALGVGVLPMAVNAASLRWQRRNQYADAIVGSGILSARLGHVAGALTAVEARIDTLADRLARSADPHLNELASLVTRAAVRLHQPDVNSKRPFHMWLADLTQLTRGTRPTVSVEAPRDLDIDARLERHVRAAIQELLSNALRHADAHRIRIEVSKSGLRIRVTDDGTGFESRPHAGHGLANLERRALDLGGGMTITRRQGCLTVIDWWVHRNTDPAGPKP